VTVFRVVRGPTQLAAYCVLGLNIVFVREWYGAASSCVRVADVPLGQWESCSPRQAGIGQWEGAISIGSVRDSCESPCEVITHPWDVPNPCEGWSTVLTSREGCVSEGFSGTLGLHERLVC